MWGRRQNRPIVVTVAAAALLFFLHAVGGLRPIERAFLSLTEPISRQFYRLSSTVSSSYNANKDQAGQRDRIEELRAEVARLTVANSRYSEIAAENEKLRRALQFQADTDFRIVMASIIAQEESGEDSRGLIINQGSDHGLSVGLGVISEEGVLIGKVVDVKPATARICLATAPKCQFAAAIQNQAKTQGLTDGNLGLTIKMDFIPQLEKISVGDTVITSGLGGIIPRGLVIGRVAQVQNASNEVWQAATIEPLVNFSNLTVVSVVIP